MPTTKRPSAAQQQNQCDAWNSAHPVGTLVSFEFIQGEGETFRGKSRSEAQVLSGHSPMIWLEGKSGCVHLGHCTAVSTPDVLRIILEDRGQDFTEWYVRDGVVIDCQPDQGRVWVGTRVLNQVGLEPGGIIEIVSKATGAPTTLNYLATSIETLSPEVASEVEGYGRKWADMMAMPHSELGL